jgi:hypothetical protein
MTVLAITQAAFVGSSEAAWGIITERRLRVRRSRWGPALELG